MMQHAIDEYHAQGVDDILIYPIGRKVAEKVAKMGLKSAEISRSWQRNPIPLVARR